jgi:hypothetical protein
MTDPSLEEITATVSEIAREQNELLLKWRDPAMIGVDPYAVRRLERCVCCLFAARDELQRRLSQAEPLPLSAPAVSPA